MEANACDWAGKRVCVTGGTGFLGAHIVRQLLDAGARVRILTLPSAAESPLFDPAAVETVRGDVRDAQVVRQATADCAVIFHTAGMLAFWGPALAKMHLVNVEGTRTVLAAAGPGTRVVHTSSLVAVGASRTGEVLSEDSPFNLHDFPVDYVQSKYASEQVALAAAERGQDVVVTNPGYIVGPDDHEPSGIGRLCVRFWKGRTPLAAPGGFNFVDVRDVARGHLLAAMHGRSGRRYVLGGENQTIRQFMTLLAEVAGLRPRLLPRLPLDVATALTGLATCRAWFTGKPPYPSLQHLRLNRYHWFCRSDRAAREIGYSARPLVEAVTDTYRWFCARGGMTLRGFNHWWMRPAQAA